MTALKEGKALPLMSPSFKFNNLEKVEKLSDNNLLPFIAETFVMSLTVSFERLACKFEA